SLLSVFTMVWSLSLLTSQQWSWLKFAAALSLGMIACASQFHGNLVWPLGVVSLLLCRCARRSTLGPLLAWSACGAVMLILAYQRLQTLENTAVVLARPLQVAAFLLTYIGAPLASRSDTAAM